MAADSTCSLKFGPEWIRQLSDSSLGQAPQAQPTQATPPRKYPLAKHRYGKEELIAIYEHTLYGDSVPPLSTPGFVYCDGVYIEQSQTPRSLIPMTDEEQRLWAFQRVASSRGRGRGITPAPWAAARSVGGHLQRTRNWRAPDQPLSSSNTQSAMSASSSQFNYWRKNSLNEDEKVPEWADEKVSEDNDNVGSFDEKGGFLSLENRGRAIEGSSSISSPGYSSFLHRSIPGAGSETQLQSSTLLSGIESNVSNTLIDKAATPPSSSSPPSSLQPVIETGVPDSNPGFPPKQERTTRDLDSEKASNESSAGNSLSCASAANSTAAGSRAPDADSRSSLGQHTKRAQVVILSGAGAGNLESVSTVGGVNRDITTPVTSDGSHQPRPTWAAPKMDIQDTLLWYYKDPQGIIQGPFSAADMLEWSNQGYFHDNLECRRACDAVFNPLGALKKVWNGALPFYISGLHGPISTLLHSVSASPPSAAYNVSNISMGLGVNPLSAVSQALNGFVASTSATSVAVSSVSPITSINSSAFGSGGPAYFEESSPQFNTLTQQQSDFDGRSTALGRQQLTTVDGDVGSDPLGVGRNPASSRVQLETDLRDLESSIRRRSVQDHSFNQTVHNHMSVSMTETTVGSSTTTSSHRRGIISDTLSEHVGSTATTAASVLAQQADSWFSTSPSNSNVAYHRGDRIQQTVNSMVDHATVGTAHHRTITQHELPNSWLVQRKNERNAEEIQRSPLHSQIAAAHHDETEHLAALDGAWNDFEYGDSTSSRKISPVVAAPTVPEDDDDGDEEQANHQDASRSELLQHLRKSQSPDREQQSEEASSTRLQGIQQATPEETAPFEKVAERKKKKDRKEKQREEKLLREKLERDEDQRKQLAQQNSTDEDADWDSGEQSAAGKMSSYHQDVIIPAPAPAVPAWGNTQDKTMSALSLQEIQRLEEERASKERQQRQREAVKNGYHSGIRTWANAIAPTKSFDQIQKEQQASKGSSGGVHNKQPSKGTPAVSYPPLSAADVVANGIGGAPSAATTKSSTSKNTVKMSSAQIVKTNVPSSHINNNSSGGGGPTSNNNVNNNSNGPTANHSNIHHTINNNAGDKSQGIAASETTNNEQQLIDWCAQITKGLNSYLDMPTVVSILKDVESEAEIEDYVSQFFGESLKEPRQFARQFVQKRAKFNVGLASSLPKQSEWCTTGGNKKRKGTKK